MDKINERYGSSLWRQQILLHRSDMPNVIAPAWKPFGHRKNSIENILSSKSAELIMSKYLRKYQVLQH